MRDVLFLGAPSSRALLLGIGLTFLGAAAGCGKGGGASGAAPSAAASAPRAGGEGALSSDGIPQADVQKLLDAWLAAQNSGDVNAYLALYAQRFEGVRRSGERAARMDRKGWAADRTKMFAKKMVVAADDVFIGSSADVAQVNFTQTWASGSYKDVGPKLLVIVKEKGSLRIAREEMLASTLQGVRRLPPYSPADLAFVIQDGGTRVVLDTSPQSAWAEGAPELLADAEPYPTKMAVNAGKLRAALASWGGKKVRLYGPAGPVCEATLGSLSLIGRVIPHFGEVGRWHGTGDHQGEAPLPKAQIARAAWDLSRGSRPSGVVLAAELEGATGDCKGALWAQPSSAPVRPVAKAEPADAAFSKQVLEALRKLPEYQQVQATSDVKGPWDERGKTEVVRMRHPSGKELAFISANAVDGCGGFQGNLSAVFEVSGDRLQIAGKPMGSPPEMPLGVVDPGDGKLPILFRGRLLRGEAGYDQLDTLTIPFLDCDC